MNHRLLKTLVAVFLMLLSAGFAQHATASPRDPFAGSFFGDLVQIRCAGGLCGYRPLERLRIRATISGNGFRYRYRNSLNGEMVTLLPYKNALIGRYRRNLADLCVETDTVAVGPSKKGRNKFVIRIDIICIDNSGGTAIFEGNLRSR